MRKSIYFLVFVLMFVSVSASNYEVTLVTDFNDVVDTGDVSLGTFVLTPTPVNITEHILQKNNTLYPTITLTQFDKVKLSQNNIQSLNFNNTIITPGSTVQFNQPGQYTYSEVINTNITGTIIVKKLNPLNISLKLLNINFDYLFSENNFKLSTEKAIDVSLDIPKHSLPVQYTYILQINYDGNLKNHLGTFEIQENKDWNVTSFKYIKSINSGETGSAGNITIINNGNTESVLNIELNGNLTKIFSVVKTSSVFPNIPTTVQLVYNLGKGIKIGNYTGDVIITGNNKTYTKPLSILVRDAILPEIDIIELPNFMTGLSREIKVKVSDNTGVNNIFVTPLYKNGSKYVNEERKGFIKDEGTDWWLTDITLNRPGDYVLTLEVIDTDKNIYLKNYTVNSGLQNVVSYEDYYKFLTTKYNRWTEIEFITVNETIPLDITLKEFNYKGNYSLVIVLPSGENRFLNNRNINQSIVVDEVGKYKLRFKGNIEDDFNGIFNLNAGKYHEKFKQILFDGEVKDFYVPEDTNFNWHTGEADCKIHDGGNPNSSKTVCIVEWPGYVDIKNEVLPTTLELKEKTEDEYKNRISELDKKNFSKVIIIIFLVFTNFGIFAYMVFMLAVYPKLNLKVR